MIRLNPTLIEHTLSHLAWRQSLELICLEQVSSTNDFLKTHFSPFPISVCVTECQAEGHGRLGRVWHSPKGNLYFSMRLSIEKPLSHLGSLSLVVGLSLLNALKEYGITQTLRLKWPNDVMWEGKKLGGILIEILNTHLNKTTLIIGIGLNIMSCPTEWVKEKPITSLHLIHSQPIDRNKLIAYLIRSINIYVKKLSQLGWQVFEKEWQEVDSLYLQQITLYQLGKKISGRACGVNNQGQLILEDSHGHHHVASSGDTTCQADL